MNKAQQALNNRPAESELVERMADSLMSTCFGDKAVRMVLVDEHGNDLGGRNRDSIISTLSAALNPEGDGGE